MSKYNGDDHSKTENDDHSNILNPNHDSFYESRGEDGRPEGWEEDLDDE